MRKLLLAIIPILLCLTAAAQQTYYLYFQSNDAAPFYVRVGEEVFSSRPSGYLVISGLPDSNFILRIGLANGSVQESRFDVSMQGRDQGFEVQADANAILLSDLTTGGRLTAFSDPSRATIIYESRNDAFTQLLARAAGDPSLLLVAVQSKIVTPKGDDRKISEVVKTEPAPVSEGRLDSSSEALKTSIQISEASTGQEKAAAIVRDSITVKSIETAVVPPGDSTAGQKNPNVSSSEAIEEPFTRSTVSRVSESSTSEGFGLVFYDRDGSRVDTVRLLIPNPKYVLKAADTTKDDQLFLETKPVTEVKGNSDSTKATVLPPPVKANTDEMGWTVQGSETKMPVPDCKKVAGDKDFFKLRKNMAGVDTDEAMVEQARKYFKNMCFSSEQLGNLAGLFLSSAGKYSFYEAAFLHVTDPERFSTLANTITDPYYLKRFQALLGK